MTFNARTARRLCSDSELLLYEQSRQFELQGLDEKHLKRNISRARRLHQSLLRRKRTPDSATKAALMLEIQHRFERELVKMMSGLQTDADGRGAHPLPAETAPEYARLGPPTEETIGRVHAGKAAVSIHRRAQGMPSLHDRRTQIRHDKR